MPARSPFSARAARRAWSSDQPRCSKSPKASAVAQPRRPCSAPAAAVTSILPPWSGSSRRQRRARGSPDRSRRTGCGMTTQPMRWSASVPSTWCRPRLATPQSPRRAAICMRGRQIARHGTWPSDHVGALTEIRIIDSRSVLTRPCIVTDKVSTAHLSEQDRLQGLGYHPSRRCTGATESPTLRGRVLPCRVRYRVCPESAHRQGLQKVWYSRLSSCR